MAKTSRDKEDIARVIRAIVNELVSVPNFNVFGESNKESKIEAAKDIADLAMALAVGTIRDEWTEAGSWLAGRDSAMTDYL